MQNVLVLGAGISGLGAAHVLLSEGCHVLLSDLHDVKDANEKRALTEQGVTFCIGKQTADLLKGVDTVVVSPVIPRENPVVQAAFSERIPVLSEIELAYRVTKAPILAVTGTNGKTTTTTLLGSMVSKSGKPFALAGNLGISLSREAKLVPKNGVIAAEVSSFQLEFIDRFKPKAAVILNITPDHLERHHTMEAYVAAKARIFENMDKTDSLLLNLEDPYTEELAKQASHTHVYYFSTEHEVEEGACLSGDSLVLRLDGVEVVLCRECELKLKGHHNYGDCLAAAFLAYKGGVPLECIRHALMEYKALEHRIEYVRTLDGVEYYNDSKATNTDAVVKALGAFPKPVILIAGGHDKETPISDFMKVVKQHTKHLILIGAAAKRFQTEAEKAGVSSIQRADSMASAVELARKEAVDGDTVLLSPACSSFDMYSCYEERGDDFKRIVNGLK